MSRPPAISFNPFQKASSRLTLVLWPATTIDRLTTADFTARPPFRSIGGRPIGRGGRSRSGLSDRRKVSPPVRQDKSRIEKLLRTVSGHSAPNGTYRPRLEIA